MAKKKKDDFDIEKKGKVTFGQIIMLIILMAYAIFCIAPVILIIVAAFTDEQVLNSKGFRFIPEKWSMHGMDAVLKYGTQLFDSYIVTIGITVVGTLFGLLIMSLFAYALSRKDFRMRKFLSIYIMIPMLFTGGQLSCYMIFTTVYNMMDNLLLLILPLCVSTMNIIIMRTYIQTSVPEELMESARIDGASETRTFFQIVFPLMKPSLAAVGFMMATAYWNDWQNAMLYISSPKKQPLQLLLIRIQASIDVLLNTQGLPSSVIAQMGAVLPKYSATMATVVVVVGPIIILYPFFQKYFAKGLTMGSVKG